MAEPPYIPPSEADDPVFAAENKGPSIVTIIVIVTVLETLFAGARLYVRGRIMKKLQLDDYIIIVAVVCGWAAVALGIKAAQGGNGKHFIHLTTQQKSDSILYTTAGFCPGIMSFGLPKLAVIHLLTRLMNPGRPHRIFLWCMGILCNLILLGCVAILFGQCTPSRSQWIFSIPESEKSCIDKNILVVYTMFAGAVSAFTDLYLAIYPAVVLFSLQLQRRKKIALTVALGIGSIAGFVAIYKTTQLPGLGKPDFTWETSSILIWTCVEGSTMIIASSIPILQPLADRVLHKGFFGSSFGTRKYKHYGSGKNGQDPSAVELSYQAKKRSARDPNGLTFLDQTLAGSEESILPAKEGGKHDVEAVQGRPRSLSPGSRRIMRTDDVTVSHSAASQEAVDHGTHQARGYAS